MLKKGHGGLAVDHIDQGAGRHLACHRADRAETEREADPRLGPALGRQINRDERPEPSLDVGDEQVEPVEATASRNPRCTPEAR